MSAPGAGPPPPESGAAGTAAPVASYESPRSRARTAGVVLLVIAAFDALALLTEALQLVVLGRVASGEEVPEALVSGNDFAFGAVGALQFVLFVAGAITFIRWLRRAYGNLHALGQRTLRRGPGWTIGAWFVPILNLFWPYQLVGDTWRGSNPLAPAEGVSDVSRPSVPALVDWWWALC